MISVREFENELKKLGDDYFVNEFHEVPDIASWAKEHEAELGEPHLPMKLVTHNGDSLSMVVQSHIDEKMLSDVVKNLAIRWSVRDNAVDMEKKLDSTRKRLAYCFLKEYARALQKIEGGELLEDEWVFEEMEYLGYFNE
jgi:hypothetical protein